MSNETSDRVKNSSKSFANKANCENHPLFFALWQNKKGKKGILVYDAGIAFLFSLNLLKISSVPRILITRLRL